MRRARTGAVAVVLLACAIAALCTAAGCTESAPADLTDDQGRVVHLDAVPTRIVSHVPSITETLFALGLGDKIVGVSDHCNYPAEAADKAKVGGYYAPSIEKIAALDPDLVLTDGYAGDIPQLDSLGIPYIVVDPPDIDGLIRDIELLGEATGSSEKAAEIVSDFENRVEAVVAAVSNASEPRVFYVFDATDLTKPWTAGPGSFVDALITLAAGENVAGEAQGSWIQFSMEELVNSDPEVILVDSTHGTATVAPADLKENPLWQGVSGVSSGRIGVVDGDLVNRPGPRLVEGLEEIARIVHPELFDH